MSVSRRNFLKRAGGVAVVAAVAPSTLATTAPRESLVEQRIPDYEPPSPAPAVAASNPYVRVDYITNLARYGLVSQQTAMEMLGFNPDHGSLMANYVRDVLLKDFPQ